VTGAPQVRLVRCPDGLGCAVLLSLAVLCSTTLRCVVVCRVGLRWDVLLCCTVLCSTAALPDGIAMSPIFEPAPPFG
jgi:hypothetical protein